MRSSRSLATVSSVYRACFDLVCYITLQSMCSGGWVGRQILKRGTELSQTHIHEHKHTHTLPIVVLSQLPLCIVSKSHAVTPASEKSINLSPLSTSLLPSMWLGWLSGFWVKVHACDARDVLWQFQFNFTAWNYLINDSRTRFVCASINKIKYAENARGSKTSNRPHQRHGGKSFHGMQGNIIKKKVTAWFVQLYW